MQRGGDRSGGVVGGIWKGRGEESEGDAHLLIQLDFVQPVYFGVELGEFFGLGQTNVKSSSGAFASDINGKMAD